ncbi:MAG: DnaD domain protein [Hydrogenoanaerobacterium sp.]
MNYSISFGLWSNVFAVPTQIVDKHIKMCGAAQLKVLLLLLRSTSGTMELSEISSALNISTGDTQDALNYWIGAGVLTSQPSEGNCSLTVNEQSTLKQTANTPVQAATTEASPKPFPEDDEKNRPAEAAPQTASPEAKPARARLNPAEVLEMSKHNSELKTLLDETEASLGKTLSSADISTLASLYDWAGIKIDVLLTVMEYCKQKGKTNLRYVEKVALNWQEKGIDTFEKAERYIKETLERDAREDICKSAFGIYDRRLTTKETEFVRSWFADYKFDISIIKLAYERSIEHTGKVSFPYINKVLTNWHEQNVKTPEDASKEEKAFNVRKNEKTQGKSSYDIDEFEQYLMRETKKGGAL